MRDAKQLRVVTDSWVRGATPNNLPRRLTSFVGRRSELRRARRLLHDGRLLTLTGPAGAGKSRMAVQMAEATLAEFPDGAWVVELASLDQADLIPFSIAAELGLAELTGADTVQQLIELLRQRSVLLVLDNCEHLVQACGDVAKRLLEAVPALKLLVTSREPLGLDGEAIYLVPALSLSVERFEPATRGESSSDAVALFVDRIRAHQPDFYLTSENAAVVGEICRRVDGLPLAIELAAAHARHLSLPDLAAHLGGGAGLVAPKLPAGARLQGLDYALDRSYDLLTPAERDLFLRLSVCPGGFDLDTAGDICDRVAEAPNAPEVVWRLLDRSLLTTVEGARGRSRYRMLEPIRDYGVRRLAATAGLATAHERQAHHYATLVRTAAGELSGGDQATWLDRLEEELANIRAALEWACDHDADLALEMAGTLWFFWAFHGHVGEGRRWLERTLALGPGKPSLRGWALAALGYLAASGPNRSDALAPAEEALELSGTIGTGTSALRVRALLAVGHATLRVDRERGAEVLAHAVETARQLADPALVAETLTDEAVARFMLGQRERATTLAEEALVVARELGNRHLTSSSAGVLARDATFEGRPEAERLWAETLASSRELGDPEQIQFCLGWLAVLAAARGDLGAAVAAEEEALRITRVIASWRGSVQVLDHTAIISFHADRPVWALNLAASARGAKGPGWVESPFWARQMEDVVDGARAKLPAAASDQAWEEGAAMGIEAAVGVAESILNELGRLNTSRRRSGALTRRELDVAGLIGLGFTNRELARRLFISERTAEGHVQHIFNKLGFDNRSQIAAWVAREGPTATSA